MRVDCHSHTCYSPDSASPLSAIVRRCLQVGIDCLCVTDHNTVQGALEMRRQAPFMVIVGEEIRTTRGDIIGLFLQEEVPRGLTPERAAQEVHDQGGLVSVPHPFDRFRGSRLEARALLEIAHLVDVVEAHNARTVLPVDDQRALAWAETRGKGKVVCSDSHHPAELGATYLEMEPFADAAGFLRALPLARRVTRRAGPLVHLWSRLALL